MCVLEGSVCLKCVFTSRITFSLNLVLLYTTVSKNIVSVNFGGEFNSRVIKIYLPWFTYVPQRKNVIHVAFPNSWLEHGFAYLIHASRQRKLLLLVCAHRARYSEFV